MIFHLLFTGFLLGLVLCLPLGPIGMLSVRRTMVYGEMAGVLTILGAACADACYFFVAGYGLAQIPEFIERYRDWFQVIAGVVLLIVGLSIYFKKIKQRKTDKVEKAEKSMPAVFISSFLFMLSNPLPVIAFMAAVSSISVLSEGALKLNHVLLITLGAFLGSAVWAPVLVVGGRILKDYSRLTQSPWLNRISGLVIIVFGFILLGELLISKFL